MSVISQNLPLEAAERLGIGADLVITHANVQLAVGSEMDAAAVVASVGAQGVDVQQVDLAAGNRSNSISREPAYPIVGGRAGNRVINVNILVRREIRIDRDAQQSALVGRINVQAEKRRVQEMAIFEDPQLASLLGHEQAAVGREGHCRGINEPAGHHGLRKAGRQTGQELTPFEALEK